MNLRADLACFEFTIVWTGQVFNVDERARTCIPADIAGQVILSRALRIHADVGDGCRGVMLVLRRNAVKIHVLREHRIRWRRLHEIGRRICTNDTNTAVRRVHELPRD